MRLCCVVPPLRLSIELPCMCVTMSSDVFKDRQLLLLVMKRSLQSQTLHCYTC